MALDKEKVNKKKNTSKTKKTSVNKTTSTKNTNIKTSKTGVNQKSKKTTNVNQLRKNNTKEKQKANKKTTNKVSKSTGKKIPVEDKKISVQSENKVLENKKEKKKISIKVFFTKIGRFFVGIGLFFKKMFSKLSFKKKKSDSEIKKVKKNVSTKNEPLFTPKTKKLFIIVSIICLLIILGECIYLFVRYLDIESKTVHYDSLNSVAIDNSGVVAAGSSNFRYSKYNKYTKGLEKAKLIKYDNNGKVIFEVKYKKGINTTFSSVISVSDGYIVVGSGVIKKKEKLDEAREAIILKYDKDGKLVWEKFYQVITNTRFNKVIETNDGYIAIGQSIYANMELGNHTTGGGIIVKYDKEGNVVWKNNHGGTKSGNFNDIVEVNGSYYVVGKDASDYGNIVKYNSNGEYQWHKNYSFTDGFGF